MESEKISKKLSDLVYSYAGVLEDFPASASLIGPNAKYLGRISGLLPIDPLQQALANTWIHKLASVIPYLSTEQGVTLLQSTVDSLLPVQPVFALELFSIVDLLIISIASTTEAFKSIPWRFRKVEKYLNSLRTTTPGKEIPQQEVPASKRSFNVVYGTGGRYRVDYVLRTPELIGNIIIVKGWAKTARIQGGGEFAFIELNDGSSVKNLQIVVSNEFPGFERIKGTGFSVSCKGLLIESPGDKQPVEMQIKVLGEHSFEIIGDCEQDKYPLAKKNHSLEYLREMAHLRPRSNFIGCVARVRNALAFATHQFFNSRGFLYIHTPVITSADCEGAGEMFQVTTALTSKVSEIPLTAEGQVDYSKDFFGKPAFLTVSGQLAVENYSCALSDVYTFGPTFRAENSHTSRHLAEFWMIEPELSWCGLEGNMECAESYLKYCLQYVFDNCYDDLAFFEERIEQGLINRLKNVLERPFARMTYTEALEQVQKSGKNFTTMPVWGDDLQSEHERYISEDVVKGPVIVYNYPKVLKSFYMKLNDDGTTVQAMDILVPKIGEVVGGSVREDRLEHLDEMIQYKGLNKESYWWYRQLRMYGSVPHAGFGLGFERLVMMATGVENIREVIPFPRWPGHAEF